MRNYFLLILVLPVFFGSCKKPNETDPSYTLEAYQELGMPDYNTVWSMTDYKDAYYALVKLKYEKPFALPARESEKSGELFSRIINLENLSFLQDETLPLHEKARIIMEYLNIHSDYMDVYTNLRMKKQYYARELVDIDIFGIRIAQKMLDLGNEINQSEDPGDVAMQSGFSSIQKMYLTFLTDMLEKQQHTSQYPEKTLELLCDTLSNSIRRNMEWFDEDASEEIKQGMHAVIDSTSSQRIKTDYRDLIEVL
ncbi:MAG: hypothetical protein ABFS38_21015, partial [Bacteroidota bacterium]